MSHSQWGTAGHNHHRQNAIEQAKSIMEKRPLFLDTETTGTGGQAEVIEIAVIWPSGYPIYDGLVKPLGRVENGAYRVHHIDDKMLESAPYFDEVWGELSPLLNGQTVVTYNAEYDSRVIRQSYDMIYGAGAWAKMVYSIDFRCAMTLYAEFRGEINPQSGSYKWHKLEEAGRQCQIDIPNSHRAADDARLARALMLHMASQEA